MFSLRVVCNKILHKSFIKTRGRNVRDYHIDDDCTTTMRMRNIPNLQSFDDDDLYGDNLNCDDDSSSSEADRDYKEESFYSLFFADEHIYSRLAIKEGIYSLNEERNINIELILAEKMYNNGTKFLVQADVDNYIEKFRNKCEYNDKLINNIFNNLSKEDYIEGNLMKPIKICLDKYIKDNGGNITSEEQKQFIKDYLLYSVGQLSSEWHNNPSAHHGYISIYDGEIFVPYNIENPHLSQLGLDEISMLYNNISIESKKLEYKLSDLNIINREEIIFNYFHLSRIKLEISRHLNVNDTSSMSHNEFYESNKGLMPCWFYRNKLKMNIKSDSSSRKDLVESISSEEADTIPVNID